MESLTNRVLKSSFVSFLIKFVQKSLGLISTLILARLLTPEDFGIVAVAALVLHFCDVLSTAGSEQYLIQKKSLSKEDIDSSWTLELILKSSLFLLLYISIPFIADFYENSELKEVLLLSATVLLINAFKSPGIALLKKDLRYKKIFVLNVSQKVIVFSFIMGWVYINPSFWALIVGDVVSAFILTVGSYFIHPCRPKLGLSKVKEQFQFSKWVMLKSGVGYSRAQMDMFFVAKLFTAELVGVFHMARQLALMPSTDLIAPAIDPLLSAFSKAKEQAERVKSQFELCFLVIAVVIIPIAVYMWFFPETIIDVLLGEQWSKANEILQALTLLLVAFTINQLLSPFCMAIGKVKAMFYYDLLSFVFIFVGLYLFSELSLYNFAILRGFLAFIPLVLMLLYVCHLQHISVGKITINFAVLLALAYSSAYVTKQLQSYVDTYALFELTLFSGCFFVSFLLKTFLFGRFVLKGFTEWQTIITLVLRVTNNMKGKLGRVKDGV